MKKKLQVYKRKPLKSYFCMIYCFVGSFVERKDYRHKKKNNEWFSTNCSRTTCIHSETTSTQHEKSKSTAKNRDLANQCIFFDRFFSIPNCNSHWWQQQYHRATGYQIYVKRVCVAKSVAAIVPRFDINSMKILWSIVFFFYSKDLHFIFDKKKWLANAQARCECDAQSVFRIHRN